MKLRFFFLITLSTLLLASCRKEESFWEASFSVLGDSYSAFAGYVDPDSNDPWPNYSQIEVTKPEQMWWYQVADQTGWTMERNNSFSGSLICNMDVANYYGKHSFIRRMDDLGEPDVIFIFGATNDANHDAPLGDFVYADWTEEQLCMFRPALAYLLDYLQKKYPYAELYLMIDMNLGSGGIDDSIREAFIDSMHQIATHYQVHSIDLYDIHKQWWHPDSQGQEGIATQVVRALRAGLNA